VPYSAYVAAKGDWHTVFWIGAAANIIVAFLAILVLKPMRAAHGRRQADAVALQAGA
jgi:MFS transporter, OFA family, oxalate/formate antiporter